MRIVRMIIFPRKLISFASAQLEKLHGSDVQLSEGRKPLGVMRVIFRFLLEPVSTIYRAGDVLEGGARAAFNWLSSLCRQE